MIAVIKLSATTTRQSLEIPVLFEDEYLLALDKPANLLTSPDRYDRHRPNLMRLLHDGIAQGKPWAKEHGLTYLMNAHQLDSETSGVILLGKSKLVLTALVNVLGSGKLKKNYVALVLGTPKEACFEIEAKLAPHPSKPGLMRVYPKHGKKSRSRFEVLEEFPRHALLRCRSFPGRTHQIRVHLSHARLPIVGDALYGGKPLLLSSLKRDYRVKPGQTERPLIATAALHAERVELVHPVTGQTVAITAPWPKDLTVAVKYLRRYAAAGSSGGAVE